MKRRFLAMLLSLVMVFAMLPVSAFATGAALPELEVTVSPKAVGNYETVTLSAQNGGSPVSQGLYYTTSESAITALGADDTLQVDTSVAGGKYVAYSENADVSVTEGHLYVAMAVSSNQSTATAWGTAPIIAPDAISFEASTDASQSNKVTLTGSIPNDAKITVLDAEKKIPATKDTSAISEIQGWTETKDNLTAEADKYICVAVLDNAQNPTAITKWGIAKVTAQGGGDTAVNKVTVTLGTSNLTTSSNLPQASITTEPANGATATTEWYSGESAEGTAVNAFAEAGKYTVKITVTAEDGFTLTGAKYTLDGGTEENLPADGVLTKTVDVAAAQGGGDTTVNKVTVTLGTSNLTTSSNLPQASITTEPANGATATTEWYSGESAEGTAVNAFAEAGKYTAKITVTAANGFTLTGAKYTLDDGAEENLPADGVLTKTVDVAAAPSDNTTVSKDPEISDNGTATGTVDEEMKGEVADAVTGADSNETITLDFSGPSDSTVTVTDAVVEIPKEVVNDIATAKDGETDKKLSLEVATPVGSVTLPAPEVKDINDKVKDDTTATKVVLVIAPKTVDTAVLPPTEAANVKAFDIAFHKNNASGAEVAVNNPVQVTLKTDFAVDTKLTLLLIDEAKKTVEKLRTGLNVLTGGMVKFDAPHLSVYAFSEDDKVPANADDGTKVEVIVGGTNLLTADKLQNGTYVLDDIAEDSITLNISDSATLVVEGVTVPKTGNWKTVDLSSTDAKTIEVWLAGAKVATISAKKAAATTPTVNTLTVSVDDVQTSSSIATHKKITVTNATSNSRYIFKVQYTESKKAQGGWFTFTTSEPSIILLSDKEYKVEITEVSNTVTGDLIVDGSVSDAAKAKMTGYVDTSVK